MKTPKRSLRLAGAVIATATALSLGAVAAPAQAAPAHGAQPTAHAIDRAHPIPFTAANVTQNADGSFTVSWASDADLRGVTVYAGTSQWKIDERHAVAHGQGTDSVTVTGLGQADRWWFRLQPSRGEGLTLADRSLHLASAPNFRDAGGYRTSDGSWVRMGVVYRSGDISKLSADDLAKLQRLGVHTIYDLRTDSERSASPDQVPAGATDTQENVLGNLGGLSSMPSSPAAAVAMMQQAEVGMVDLPSAQASYQAVFKGIENPWNLGVLYHCTAGKDRTGWASAVLLTALGVPQQTVDADYLASNDYNAGMIQATLAHLPASYQAVYKPLLVVDQSYLDAGLNEVTSKYGTFDAYLHQGLGLSDADLHWLKAELLVG
jgi:protein-tyrosine phosphatase